MLQDGAHATVIGAPTYGAGCGWNLPHQEVILTHSGGALALPNCARLRADGSNEIDGITPDVMIGFRQADTTAQRVARLMAALPIALERAVS